MCESNVEDDSFNNDIDNIFDNGDGTYTMTLLRPITPGAVTTIKYASAGGQETVGTFTSHPANVTGDPMADAADVGALIDCLTGAAACTVWQCDADRSGRCAQGDLPRVIDLLNQPEADFGGWIDTLLPTCGSCCPQ